MTIHGERLRSDSYLAELVVHTARTDLGAPSALGLKNSIVDTIGCALASVAAGLGTDVRAAGTVLRGGDSESGDCGIIGISEKGCQPAAAALAGATLAHGFDFDDVHLPSVAHLSTITVPVALAMCQALGCGGGTLLTAVCVGDEVGGRVGRSVSSSAWEGSAIRKGGFFPTAVLGTLAAAATASKVADLSVSETRDALAIAASLAGGLASVSRGDSTGKRLAAGWAAMSGIAAVHMASCGYSGPRDFLETNQGFYHAFSNGLYDPERLHTPRPERWVCEEFSLKPYPIEYVIQPLVELAVRARHDLGDIDGAGLKFEASVPTPFKTLFHPSDVKTRPSNSFEAIISAPYCIAMAFAKPPGARISLRDFTEFHPLEPLVKIAKSVSYSESEDAQKGFPDSFGGSLRVVKDGSIIWDGKVDDVYGSPRRPMKQDEIREKFLANSSALGAQRAQNALDTLADLEHVDDIASVMGSLATEPCDSKE